MTNGNAKMVNAYPPIGIAMDMSITELHSGALIVLMEVMKIWIRAVLRTTQPIRIRRATMNLNLSLSLNPVCHKSCC